MCVGENMNLAKEVWGVMGSDGFRKVKGLLLKAGAGCLGPRVGSEASASHSQPRDRAK